MKQVPQGKKFNDCISTIGGYLATSNFFTDEKMSAFLLGNSKAECK